MITRVAYPLREIIVEKVKSPLDDLRLAGTFSPRLYAVLRGPIDAQIYAPFHPSLYARRR